MAELRAPKLQPPLDSIIPTVALIRVYCYNYSELCIGLYRKAKDQVKGSFYCPVWLADKTVSTLSIGLTKR